VTQDVFIYDAVRTPRGKGKMRAPLSALRPQELVRQLVEALRGRHGEQAVAGVERLILSCVGQTGDQGGNIAMVSKLHVELADDTIALTINNFCSGGLSAVALSADYLAHRFNVTHEELDVATINSHRRAKAA